MNETFASLFVTFKTIFPGRKKLNNKILRTDLLYIQKETITNIINEMYLHNHYPKINTKIIDTLNTSGVLTFPEQTQFYWGHHIPNENLAKH